MCQCVSSPYYFFLVQGGGESAGLSRVVATNASNSGKTTVRKRVRQSQSALEANYDHILIPSKQVRVISNVVCKKLY